MVMNSEFGPLLKKIVSFGINHHKGHDGHKAKVVHMSSFVSLVTLWLIELRICDFFTDSEF
jgi:hypothetical protein